MLLSTMLFSRSHLYDSPVHPVAFQVCERVTQRAAGAGRVLLLCDSEAGWARGIVGFLVLRRAGLTRVMSRTFHNPVMNLPQPS